MSMEKLFEKFASDDAFAQKYAGLSSLDDVLKQAREDGYSVTEEEAKAYIADHSGELSDENLSSVAGGFFGSDHKRPAAAAIAFDREISRQKLRNRLSCELWQ
jgi:predicted ribosomally synthesized peptide with nif11-like leader